MSNEAPSTAHAPVTAGVLRETSPGEHRVALTPDAVTRLGRGGIDVLVESEAGHDAWFADADYVAAGARIAPRDEIVERADALLGIGQPPTDVLEALAPGKCIAGLLRARTDEAFVTTLRDKGILGLSLDLLPRTVSSAQSMDALTSQANVAGYKAVLVAAGAFGRYLPMLMTAAGTMRPATLLVLGAGVAGLQAIGTAHRLGAVVTGYDVRSTTRDQVESLGATFLELDAPSAEGTGGYARALTAEEQKAQQDALQAKIADFDIVITTAQVPGRRPPQLVTAGGLAGMKPGSVVVDLAASELGGNVEGSVPDDTVVLGDGVTVIGAGSLPATVPTAASTAFARNVGDLLQHVVRDGAITIDPDDPIDAAVAIGAVPGARASDREPDPTGATS